MSSFFSYLPHLLLEKQLLALYFSNFHQSPQIDVSLLLVPEHVAILDVFFGLIDLLYEDLREFVLFFIVDVVQKGLLLTVEELLRLAFLLRLLIVLAGLPVAFLLND